MSSTKIVIIVLVLIGVIFVIFVVRGASRNEPSTRSDAKAAKRTDPPDWTKSIAKLFSSLQPRALEAKVYSSPAKETIPPDEKQAFRTVTFHVLSGAGEIVYHDNTPLEPDSPLEDLDNPQKCTLPQDADPDVRDRTRCSILALKQGGTLTLACALNTPCRIEIE